MSNAASCSEECHTNPAYTAQQAVVEDCSQAVSEAEAALTAIKDTLKDAQDKKAAADEMKAECGAVQKSIQNIGNTVLPDKNWEEFNKGLDCINDYCAAVNDFIAATEAEVASVEARLAQAKADLASAQARLATIPPIVCSTVCY